MRVNKEGFFVLEKGFEIGFKDWFGKWSSESFEMERDEEVKRVDVWLSLLNLTGTKIGKI